MGILATSSETTFPQSPEDLDDFVTDPRNWPLTYPGSGAIEDIDTVPLQVGDVWSESGGSATSTSATRGVWSPPSAPGASSSARSMTTEVPKHGRLPAQVVAAHEPSFIDHYHDTVGAVLAERAGG